MKKKTIKITRYVMFLFCFFLSMSIQAKRYPFDMKHQYIIETVRVDQQGYKFCKVWGIADTVDAAMNRALQDAVAACLFSGIPGNENTPSSPAICGSAEVYEKNKKYFNAFFKSGEFLHYVRNVNSRYPSGENNVKYKGWRKVAVYVQISYDELRKKMERDGIIRGLDNYFN